MRKEVRWERMFPDELEAAFTFAEVEQIWTETVSPALKTFETMKNPDESPPEDSQWFRQCELPEFP